jgi:hypothetical protein
MKGQETTVELPCFNSSKSISRSDQKMLFTGSKARPQMVTESSTIANMWHLEILNEDAMRRD